MRRWVGERPDELQLLHDRTRPAMGDDHGESVSVLRADVNEVDVEPVNLRDEVRHGVDPVLAPAPVVAGLPIVEELLGRLQRHTLLEIGHGLPLGQPSVCEAPTEVGEIVFRCVEIEWPYRACSRSGGALRIGVGEQERRILAGCDRGCGAAGLG